MFELAELGQTLLALFSGFYEFITTPFLNIDLESIPFLGDYLENPAFDLLRTLFNSLLEATGLNFSLFDFVLGAGFTGLILFKFIKFITDVVL